LNLYIVSVTIESDYYDDWDSSIILAARSKRDARAIAKEGAWDCFEEYQGRLISMAGKKVRVGPAEEIDMTTDGIIGHSGQW